jgi:hypothetical protein
VNVKPADMVVGKHYIGYVGSLNGWAYMGEYLGHHPDDPNITNWKWGRAKVIHLNDRNVRECSPDRAVDGGLRYKLEALAQQLELTANSVLNSGMSDRGMARDVSRQIRKLLEDTR